MFSSIKIGIDNWLFDTQFLKMKLSYVIRSVCRTSEGFLTWGALSDESIGL
jgi:hypothetical protein